MNLHTTFRTPLVALALISALGFAPEVGEAQLTMAQAQTAIDAAEAEARANDWNLTILVADADGVPVYMRRMD